MSFTASELRDTGAWRFFFTAFGAGLLFFAAVPSATVRAVAGASPKVCRAAIDISSAQAAQAVREGAGFAERHEGYGVAPWVLYASADPLRAEPDRAGVDAVIVETPFERIRNESYLQRYQGESITRAAAARMRRAAAGTIGFIVYAHSRSDHDRGFMGGYAPAVITLDDRRQLISDDIVRFGPASDFFDVGNFRGTRWTGSLTYRFTLPPDLRDAPCSIAGTLEFSDGHGHSYRHHFQLAQYR